MGGGDGFVLTVDSDDVNFDERTAQFDTGDTVNTFGWSDQAVNYSEGNVTGNPDLDFPPRGPGTGPGPIPPANEERESFGGSGGGQNSPLNDETLETLTNTYAREAFNLLSPRGVNPLRAELLGSHEFVPMGTGEEFLVDSNSITLNFGSDSQNVVVNQIVRLIELHRCLVQTANTLSEQLLTDASGFTKDQIDGGLLISRYYFEGLALNRFFPDVVDEAYPSGEISDANINSILNKLTDSFFSNFQISMSTYLVSLFDSSNSSLTQTALDFGFSNTAQLDRTILTSEYSNNEFSRSVVRLGLIESLVPHINGYIVELLGLVSQFENSLNFSSFDSEVNINFDNNSYSDIIKEYALGGGSSRVSAGEESFLSFGTGIDNPRTPDNTIAFLNVVSNLYSSCMFMRDVGQDAGFTSVSGVITDYLISSDISENKVILASDENKELFNSIKKLKKLYPYTTSLYRTKIMPFVSQDTGRAYKLDTAGGGEYYSKLFDYGSYGAGISENSIQDIIGTGYESDVDGLAQIVSAICFDQVVGANIVGRGISDSVAPTSFLVGDLNAGAGLFPALNIFRRILYRDPVSSKTAILDGYEDFKRIFENEENGQGDLEGVFSNLSSFAQMAIGLEPDPNSEDSKYIPLEFNIENLTNKKKSAANYSGPVRSGPESFILDSIINGNADLDALSDFIDRFKAEYEKVRNFIIDYYGLNFNLSSLSPYYASGYPDQTISSAGSKYNTLTPLSYFYWFMDILANNFETVINSAADGGGKNNVLCLALFAESGSSVGEMLAAFKSAYFGLLSTEIDHRSNADFGESERESINQYAQYYTDQAVKPLLKKLFDGTGLGGLSTTDVGFRTDTSDTYQGLLSGGSAIVTEKGFDDATGGDYSEFYGLNGSTVDGVNVFENHDFYVIGTNSDVMNHLRSALGVEFGLLSDFDSNGGDQRGIKPSVSSNYLKHLFRNTPITTGTEDGGLADAVSFSVFRDHFKANAYLNSDRPISHPGQFGGIFTTSTFQRALIFYMWAMKVAKQTMGVNLDIGGGGDDLDKLRRKIPINFCRGAIQALRRLPKSDTQGFGQGNDDRDYEIDRGYGAAAALLNKVRNAMKKKRSQILNPLAYFQKIINELEDFKAQAENILNVNQSISNDPHRYVGGKLIKASGVLSQGNIVGLSEVSAGTLNKALINNFENPIDSGISRLVSLEDSHNLVDIKIMYKILTRPGFGFLSNENYGKKTILHVGVPLGMLNALRQMSFEQTGESAFQNSSKIAIHVTKVDELNPDLVFYPRTFVFDMSRFVLPKGPDGSIARHISTFNDGLSPSEILKNFQFCSASESGLSAPFVPAGGDSNDYYLSSFHLNHVHDYYLKMYCKLTTGLDFDEESFKIDSANLFNGNIDETMNEFYNDYVNSLVSLYPSANVNSRSSVAFSRGLNVSRNYKIFAPLERLRSALSTNCFDRVFSIMINERDFLVPFSNYGTTYESFFYNEPSFTINGSIQTAGQKNIAITDLANNIRVESAQDPNLLNDLQDAVYLRSYSIGLDPGSTHASKFSIQISLLKY